mgnify:FL=1
MYTVVYIEEGNVRTDPKTGKVFGTRNPSGVPCKLSKHKRRVSSRLFTKPSDAQSYADSIAPSRKAFVIQIPKEHA